MPFNSLAYLALLAIIVIVYWVLPTMFRRTFVFLASLAFYASWNPLFLWVPLLVAGIVYIVGCQITSEGSGSKSWLWLGVSALLVLLVFFKYSGFLLGNLPFSDVRHFSRTEKLAFPIGISFYTFEAIGYLVDLKQGRVRLPKFVDLVLFFFFWPNVLSGPIVRARELMPQLTFSKPFEPRYFFEGLDRLTWGLVQKTAIANILGGWVDHGFAATAGNVSTTLDGWGLAIAFGLQIYFDFAGYTNMAIGTARLLGLTLPENFRYPYHAATPPEFWSRWHMTLSRWVRDYLFFPINAKWRGAPVPLYLSLVGVMGLVGLWHGAGWNFVLWGTMHGMYLALYRIYESSTARWPALTKLRIVKSAWRVATLIAVFAAWVVFRASTTTQAGAMLGSMFVRPRGGSSYGPEFFLFTGAVALFCAFEPSVFEWLDGVDERHTREGPSPYRVIVRPLAYLLGLLIFLLFDQMNTQFIYFQF